MSDTEFYDDAPPIEAYDDIEAETETAPDEDHPLLHRLNPVQREIVKFGTTSDGTPNNFILTACQVYDYKVK